MILEKQQEKGREAMTVTIHSSLICGPDVLATETATVLIGAGTEGKTWVPDREYSAEISVVQAGAERAPGSMPA